MDRYIHWYAMAANMKKAGTAELPAGLKSELDKLIRKFDNEKMQSGTVQLDHNEFLKNNNKLVGCWRAGECGREDEDHQEVPHRAPYHHDHHNM